MYAGTKPGYEKASVYAGFIGLPSEVVAVVENVAAGPDELEQRLDVRGDRLAGQPEVLVGVAQRGAPPPRERRAPAGT